MKQKKQLEEISEMTEEKKKSLVIDHRVLMVGMLRDLGYCCTLLQNKNIVFYGGSPRQEDFDRINYAAFLILKDEEKKNGNEISLLDLVG